MFQKLKILICFAFISQLLAAQSGDVYKSEAIMHESVNDYNKAAELYEKAVNAFKADNKIDTLCVFKAGQSLVRSDQFSKAIPYLKQCISLNYNDPDVYLYLSDAYDGMKNSAEAEKVLLEGKSKYPESMADFSKKIGYLYYNMDKYQEAVDALEKAKDKSADDYSFFYLYGSALEKVNKLDESASAYEKALELNPDHKNSIIKLGIIYFKQTDYLYKKETKRYESLKNPSRIDYHESTKKLESISQGYKKALPMLEKAHEQSPKNKAIISCLAIAYKRLDMKEKSDEMSKLLK